MKILIACEESQAVTKAFRAKGHVAYSSDLIPCSGGHPEWHMQGDVLGDILYNNGSDDWDMVIGFPPCTDLCVSGARWFQEKQADGRQQSSISFFMRLVNIDCPKIAIENPIGIMSTKYRKPDQIIQPYQFGDPSRKATCLWLKGLPKLKPTNIVEPKIVTYKNGKTFSKDYGWSSNKKNRQTTYPGIAKAMSDQWS